MKKVAVLPADHRKRIAPLPRAWQRLGERYPAVVKALREVVWNPALMSSQARTLLGGGLES